MSPASHLGLPRKINYIRSALLNFYDLLSMPEELLKAHKANDFAVIEAYGFNKNISKEEIVSELINLYEKNL